MPVSHWTRFIILALMLLAAAGMYAFDLALPAGVASGVPYVAVVLLSSLLKEPAAPRWTAVVCTLLVALGYFMHPGYAADSPALIHVLNRLYAFFVIWVTALITSHRLVDEQRLGDIATMDELTGILNRRHLMTTLELALQKAARQGHAFTVCMCDLDGFKQVNDRHGHLVGDRILVGFAELLSSTVRETDIVGRYGGDEFCVAFSHADEEQVMKVLNRLLPRIPGVMSQAMGVSSADVTATFGVASLSPQADTVHALIEAADQALYRGKQSGRNCVLSASPEAAQPRSAPTKSDATTTEATRVDATESTERESADHA